MKKGTATPILLKKIKIIQYRTLMKLLYKSYELVLSFSISCWFGNLSVEFTVSRKIIGIEQRSLSFLYNRKVLSRTRSVLLDSDHFLYPECSFQVLTIDYQT